MKPAIGALMQLVIPVPDSLDGDDRGCHIRISNASAQANFAFT